MDTNDNSKPELQTFDLAPMGKGVALTTWLVLFVMAAVVAGLIVASCYTAGVQQWIWRGLAVLSGVIFLGLVIMVRTYSRPCSYEISPEGLKIVWPGRSRKLPRAAFAEMRTISLTELGTIKRKFAINGLFGAFGWFRSEYLGNIDVYLTRNDGMVYLRLKNRHPLLLTPKDHQGFLQALTEQVENR